MLYLVSIQTKFLSFFFSLLEKHCSQAAALPQSQVSPHASLLALDPILDKTGIYNQLTNSYKWASKVSENRWRLTERAAN